MLTPMTDHVTMESPLGPLTISASESAIVGLQIGHRYADQHHSEVLAGAITQLEEYFAGTRKVFELPVDLSGTPFQEAIWNTLSTISFGHTLSYQALGIAAGQGIAPRAVGGAVGRNPIPIIIPCHRVLASNNRITGYSGGDGIPTKEKLLDHEGISYR